MISLIDYINQHKTFTVGGSISSKLLIFDVDDTLIYTTANIWIMKDDKHIKTISNGEYNNYKLKNGEYFDYREFNDAIKLSREKFTKYWETLKREYKKGTHICILTARGDSKMIRQFFLNNGIDIKPQLVFAIGDPKLQLSGTIQHRKSTIIKRLSMLGYKTIVFFDDNLNNLKTAKTLEKTINIKIHTVKV